MNAEEKEKNEKNQPTDGQMYSALSFFIMLVLIGIPLWWKTTEVYRVNLPYSEIDVLHEGVLKIHMNIHVVTVDETKGKTLVNELKDIFKISKLYDITFKQHIADKAVLGSSKTFEEIEKKIKHPHFVGSLQLFEVPGLSRFTPHSILLGSNRTVYFASDTDAIKLYDFLIKKLLNEESLMDTIAEINLPVRSNLIVHSKHKVSLSSDFDILFTVINPEPHLLDVEFDISEAIEEYVGPFKIDLQEMYNFHIKSQWLYFVDLQVQTKFLNYTDKGPHYALSADLLPHVITPLEKKLASHVSQYPCLNFVLYIPPCTASPLYLYTSKGFKVEGANAFISPQWGGIHIYNPNGMNFCSSDKKLTVKVDSQYIMSVFLSQFRVLLGIPNIIEGEETKIVNAIRLWEKDFLMRARTVEQLTFAKLTLQSLSKLLGKINNIVINDHVANAIYWALDNVYKATDNLNEGKLEEAYHQSKSAFLSSERAFTDPSLLSLLYFPDDQKYAVYIPLFLPVMIPVLISFKHISHWAISKLKRSSKAKEE